LLNRPPPSPTLFPYTTLFRSFHLVETQQRFERALGQRHLEPDLEDDEEHHAVADADRRHLPPCVLAQPAHEECDEQRGGQVDAEDRKSTRLNSSHLGISYAVF